MRRVTKSSNASKNARAALTPEAREDQLISLAVDLIEQRLRDGTASSQETTTLLKLASRKSRLELEMLERQVELTKAKTENLKAQQRMDEMYAKAVDAMRSYSGVDFNDNDEDSDDEY